MGHFKDHFSDVAANYQKYRPNYPLKLFEFLASLNESRNLAWDCATGSGQAACELAKFYREVIATDASEKQIQNVIPNPSVKYYVASAEDSKIQTSSVDLVTVAQALHWFNLDEFYREVKRVLNKNGHIAVWSYELHRIEPEIDKLVEHFYHQVIGPYWPSERKWVELGVESLPFPFEKMASPQFYMEVSWDLDELFGYFSTWSATVRYIQDKKHDPLPALRKQSIGIWGDPTVKKNVRWPLSLQVGR